eukprot:GEMP01076685.1.p1 GENE.GEMP01076685.1~~GEMP01076685.1.p1  ORF type:complete len:362 (+),score=55.67 GEMP01076685.1:26-1111(+)
MGDWGTIESDPAVFTQLVHKFGSKGLRVIEIYSLEDLETIIPKVHGLVFLFKWDGEMASSKDPLPFGPEGLFFAKQVIQNACATQAILSVILNAEDAKLEENLVNFKAFTSQLDPEMRGLAISNEETIRNAHNALTRHGPYDPDKEKDREKEDAFHYVSYVPFQDKLFELDGLQSGPIELQDLNGRHWLEVTRSEIQQRIELYQKTNTELRFNLMAIIDDPHLKAQEKLKYFRHLKQRCVIKLVSLGVDLILDDELDEDDAPPDVPLFEDLTEDINVLQRMVADTNMNIVHLRGVLMNPELFEPPQSPGKKQKIGDDLKSLIRSLFEKYQKEGMSPNEACAQALTQAYEKTQRLKPGSSTD